ncbi:MAG: NUDIX domain-containing protein [Verrucomicrobiota bacterium]|nr:NUDIX domain-containing protein [Verrucomicrobiota bacterium]
MSLGKEILDVVDANDIISCSEPRSVVHRDGLLHRAVHIFVFNAEGQLFLQRRSMLKDSAPGKWASSCSGHVDSGETYIRAAMRELHEEIGLVPSKSLMEVFRVKACEQTDQEFVAVYRCIAEGPFTLDSDEISEGRWIDQDKLNEWMSSTPVDFAKSFIYIWNQYCAL